MKIDTTNENFLCSLNLLTFNIQVALYYQGSDKVRYEFIKDGVLIFSGDDYRPSPLFRIDSLESIVGLLSFLTLQKGDADDDYFKNYTEAQIAFSKSFDYEQLKGLVSDYEDIGGEYNEQAIKSFESSFNNIEDTEI